MDPSFITAKKGIDSLIPSHKMAENAQLGISLYRILFDAASMEESAV